MLLRDIIERYRQRRPRPRAHCSLTTQRRSGTEMNPHAVVAVCDSVSRRIAQGDCPTEPPQPREVLEETVLELWRWHQRHQIARDPDDEPMASGSGSTVRGEPNG